MKKTLIFCLIIASYSLQAQTVDDHIRARVSLRIGGNTTTAATGISNAMPGSPSTTLITAKGVYDWFTGVVTFAGDVSGPYNNLVLANTAVTPGTYTNATVIVDSKGRVTFAGSGTAGATYTAGTGIAIDGSNVISNTAPNVAQTTITGNAGTATALQTPRTINGTNFDGTANITVTAAAGTLTGGTLASGVTASSLTSFGASPTLVTPILGTPTSATLTNATGLPLSTGVSGALPFGNGGTGLSTLGTALQYPRTNAGATGWEWATLLTVPTNGALSASAMSGIGTWITGGTGTTTKPYFLIEPTGTTSTAWSTSGTGIGVNSASGFAGNLMDLKNNNTSLLTMSGASNGTLTVGIGNSTGSLIGGVLRTTSINSYANSFGYFTLSAANALYLPTMFVFNVANSSNPAIKRVGSGLAVRLGDDSADAPISASTATFSAKAVIGTTSAPATSSALDVVSTTGGLLLPRMTTTQRDAISSPAEGLIIYNLTAHKLNVYTGSAWETITSL